MDIILNDLSLHSTYNTSEAWECFIQFYNLIKFLQENGCAKVLCRKDIQNESICGLKVLDYLHKVKRPQQCTIDSSREDFIYSIYFDYLSRSLEAKDDADYFSLNRDDEDKSTSVALAINNEEPVISIPFEPVFQINPLQGYKNSSQKVECTNLYDKDQKDLLSFILVPAKEQKKIDPKEKPIWNLGPTTKYIGTIKTPKSFKDVGEQRAFIMKHCSRIAELNGWEYNKRVSDKNSSNEKLRKIYRSIGFKNENCYLSVDFEHPDLRFELCDKNGKHIGEVETRTRHIGKPETGHDISVR